MRIFLIILILIIPATGFGYLHSTEDWMARYLKPCPKDKYGNRIEDGRVCLSKTKEAFLRMVAHKKLILKNLDKNNLERWLSTIPFIESSYKPNATSKYYSKRLKRDVILAVGMWQVSPGNLVHYLSSKIEWNGINYEYTQHRRPKLTYAIKRGYDPKVSTEIACKLLSDLYRNYRKKKYKVYIKDPEDIDRFVVMAYNSGQRRVDNALKGIGKPLTDQTINYYHQLKALKNIMDGAGEFLADP